MRFLAVLTRLMGDDNNDDDEMVDVKNLLHIHLPPPSWRLWYCVSMFGPLSIDGPEGELVVVLVVEYVHQVRVEGVHVLS